MGYLLKAGIGLALLIGGVIVFNLQLQELLDIGTCASGNTPFQIARPCPEGTGTKIVLLMVSIVAGLIGCAIFAFRGDPPWGERKRSIGFFGLGTLAWGLFFAGTGAALLIGQPYGQVTDPATGDVVNNAGSQLGSTIVGITFLVMGLPPLLFGLWSGIKGIGRDERPAGAGSTGGSLLSGWNQMKQSIPTLGDVPASRSRSTGGARKSGGDTIGKLERLQKLREDGAITVAEFDREKAKILAEQ